MQFHSIPVCYYPSTVLLIDDNRDFLLNFVLQLDEDLSYHIFDYPADALAFLSQRHVSQSLDDEARFPLVHTEMYNPERFAKVSVIVVEQSMQDINGIQLCQNLGDHDVKKILLCSNPEDEGARVALKEGLIDSLIYKDDPHAAELITQAIEKLQFEYFVGISAALLKKFQLDMPTCLLDSAFLNLFNRICHEHAIVEFYLVDDAGSFYMLDDDANLFLLLIEKVQQDFVSSQPSYEKDFSDFLMIESSDNNAPYPYVFFRQSIAKDSPYSQLVSYHQHLEAIDAEALLML